MKGELAHMEVGRRALVVGKSTLELRDKIKIFARDCFNKDDFDHLDQEVNEWLEAHPDVRVNYIYPNLERSGSTSAFYSILIHYREAHVKHETEQD